MMMTPLHPIGPAIAAVLLLAGLTGTAVAGETSFRAIEHRAVVGYRTGNHARSCPPGQYRAHGTCYAGTDRRDDRYNADYRHRDRYGYAPHRGYLHRFDRVYIHVPYRYRHSHRHGYGPYRHGYRWGIHLYPRDGFRYGD